jgi:hypothetical protein
MRTHSICRIFLYFAVVLLAWNKSLAETLRDALAKSNISAENAALQNLDKEITSYAVLDNERESAIGYYVDDGSGFLNPPMFLDRYDKHEAHWYSAAFGSQEPEVVSKPTDLCYGSVLAIKAKDDWLFIDTHINPSAGCLLIISRDLKLKKMLYGWYLESFSSGLVLFENSEVHFAETHPMEISVYDVVRDKNFRIYPPPRDHIRADFVRELINKIDVQWCKQHERSCDPKRFTSDLRNYVVNEQRNALAFVSIFEAGDYGPKPDSEIGTEEVVYVYKFKRDSFTYRNFLMDQSIEKFGTLDLDKLVQPVLLKKIFEER